MGALQGRCHVGDVVVKVGNDLVALIVLCERPGRFADGEAGARIEKSDELVIRTAQFFHHAAVFDLILLALFA